MKNFIDVFGDPQTFNDSDICVVATDKFLSGWGCAAGKTHKQVIICPDYDTASRVASNMRRNGYIYINIRCRGSFPYYSATRYTVSYRLASDAPILCK